jgi:hypothetical protein
MQIVEMTNNQFVQVIGKAEADHLFTGVLVKYVKGGRYEPKAKAKPALFSKAHVWRTLQQA